MCRKDMLVPFSLKTIKPMKKIVNVLMLVCAVAVAASAVAQAPAKAKSRSFHRDHDYYYEVQGEQFYRLADKALDEYPPMVNASIGRKLALFTLDGLQHETRNDNSAAMREFCNSRMEKVVAEVQKPVKKGVKICRVYNEGFVAKTKSVTIAFDLVRGTYLSRGKYADTDYRIVTDEQIKAIVEQCDVMFLSHNHADHIDRWVIDLFIAAGKPVIAQGEILPDVEGVSHWRTEGGIYDSELELKSGEKLQVKIFPGYQRPLLNNVPVITTPEKYTICHTGDLYDKKDTWNWVPTVKEHTPKIDALIVNCWTPKILEVLKGFDPRYVFTAHENEMGHTIGHREAYWFTFDKLKNTEYPYVVMAWGEWYSFK